MNEERTEAAWGSAARKVDEATKALLRARKDLLEAGFGSGHPFCMVLDDLAGATTRTWDNLRAAAFEYGGGRGEQ